MKSLKILISNALAAFLDFAVGCAGVLLLANLTDHTLVWWQVLIGGLLALIPDIDALPAVFTGKSAWYDHRQTPFHRPLLVIPIASSSAWLLGGWFWGLATALLVLWHYLHDTDWVAKRYGIAWLWPLSSSYWSWRGSFPPIAGIEHHYWLYTYWLRPSALSVAELTIGSILLLMVGLFVSDLTIIWYLVPSLWVIIAWLWLSSK